jgi:hypothetical protein
MLSPEIVSLYDKWEEEIQLRFKVALITFPIGAVAAIIISLMGYRLIGILTMFSYLTWGNIFQCRGEKVYRQIKREIDIISSQQRQRYERFLEELSLNGLDK